jgi:cytidyltransferase-like protein
MLKKRGLTLGKFAPLHKGHQLVIETALAEMDELLVIIYDSPEVTPVPLTVRAGWIRNLYPQVKVIEAWDGPTEVGASPEIKRLHEEVRFISLLYVILLLLAINGLLTWNKALKTPKSVVYSQP